TGWRPQGIAAVKRRIGRWRRRVKVGGIGSLTAAIVEQIRGARPTSKQIVFALAKEQIIAALAKELIPTLVRLAATGAEVPVEIIDRIIIAGSADIVPVQHIVPILAHQQVAAAIARDGVVTGPTLEDVVVRATEQGIIAAIAQDAIPARIALNDIRP